MAAEREKAAGADADAVKNLEEQFRKNLTEAQEEMNRKVSEAERAARMVFLERVAPAATKRGNPVADTPSSGTPTRLPWSKA